MMRYSVQPRDQLFVKGYQFQFFTKNNGKNVFKNISKNMSSKYSLTVFDYAKQSATDSLKTTSKRVIPKIAEATSDLIGNTITNKITKVSKHSQQNNSEIVTNLNDKEIPKERYISAEKKQETTDDLRLIQQYNNGISKNDKFFR